VPQRHDAGSIEKRLSVSLVSQSSHKWIGLFAGRLIQLRPEMGRGYAVRCAVANYHHASTNDPIVAAERFARHGLPEAANDADPGLHYSVPASTRYRNLFGRD
jgi:hypothetical protein